MHLLKQNNSIIIVLLLFSADQWTVLMACITASAEEDQIARCVELLLSRNADPNMVDR